MPGSRRCSSIATVLAWAGIFASHQSLLDAVGNDEAAAFLYFDRNRRPQTAALHDLSPDPGVATECADFHGIVYGAVTRIHDHRVTGVVLILRGEPAKIGNEFQFAPAKRSLKGKRPETSTGEPDHHRVDMFERDWVHKREFLRGPRFGKLIDCCGHGRTIANRRGSVWKRRNGHILFRDIRVGSGIDFPTGLTFDPQKDYGTEQNHRSNDAPDLQQSLCIHAA